MKFRSLFLAGVAIVATSVLAVQAQVPGVNSTLNAVFNLVYDNSTMKPTYSATQSFTPAAAATEVCIIQGSATKTIKIRRIILAGYNLAVITDPVEIVKRSTITTGGTQGFMTKTPYDSVNSLSGAANSATAVTEYFTANPNVQGTVVGLVAELMLTWNNYTTGVGTFLTYDLGQLGSPVVLRGAAQQLSVNLNGLTFTTPQFFCTFEWTEE